MTDVFLSYARSERPLAEPIRDALAAEGLQVFFDIDGIDGGQEFPDVISEQLGRCKAVVACWSPIYFQRRWCLIEARVGLDRGILVPIAVQPFAKEASPADLRFVNFFNLSGWRGEQSIEDWARTLRTVGRLVGRDLAPDTKPSGAAAVTEPSPEIGGGIVGDDPNKGKFGASAASNGRRIWAEIAPDPGNPNYCVVNLTIRSDPTAPKLKGRVEFYLHPSFRNRIRTVEAQNGVAKFRVKAWGAFTVGVKCDNGATKLELDLAEVPGAPALFRSR